MQEIACKHHSLCASFPKYPEIGISRARGSHIPQPVPPSNESRGLTQKSDVKFDELHDGQRQHDKNYIL